MKTQQLSQQAASVSEFPAFSSAVHARFTEMSKHELYVVDVDKDTLWWAYLAAFPSGTNPVFRERTEHDCSCCRQFIKAVGNVVTIHDGKVRTIWDVDAPHPYGVVAAKMAELVRPTPIVSIFRTRDSRVGTEHNIEYLPDGQTIKWQHFHCPVATKHRSADAATLRSKAASTVGVIQRSFNELTPQAVRDVLELIDSGSLYRGTQYQKQLQAFADAQMTYLEATPKARKLLPWMYHNNPAMAIRNTAIGTLLVDLSADIPLEDAVRRYEKVVAPTNYRRSSAPITKGMITKALETLDDMFLRDSLERRHATLRDISTRDVLWVNRPAGRLLRDPLEDILTAEAKTTPRTVKAQEITINHFIEDILPRAVKVEVLVQNRHSGNFVSLTAPKIPNAAPLFAWNNPFGWSYAGNVTDSIKERVKKAGGSVTGLLRFSLAWHNTDDLDLHAHEPNAAHIYYGHKRSTSSGGTLDVDMNVGSPYTREAVENIVWPRLMVGGHYIAVHNFNKRESTDIGFTVEMEFDGDIKTFSYPHAVINKQKIEVCTFNWDGKAVTDLKPNPKLTVGALSKEIWGLKTEDWHEVNAVTLSPNWWHSGNQVGNQHWFFFIDRCNNLEPTRGFYNEFLRPDLHQHRKVFEVLASKMMVEPSDQQLSGLGFSSTVRNSLVLRVQDTSSTRTYKVKF